MVAARIFPVLRTIPLLAVVCFVGLPAYSKYSGGTGDPNDPYQIATAADLILLGETPKDYDKHFIITADIDLDPNLPGRMVFDRAVIAPDMNDADADFQGNPFTGIFDGNGYMISHLTIVGTEYLGLFGNLYTEAIISNVSLEAVDVKGTHRCVGGLVGYNSGEISESCSTGMVSGARGSWLGGVGGLVGHSSGKIAACYSSSDVSGNNCVGGLVGSNGGKIINSYSSSTVSGECSIGGLVGLNPGSIVASHSIGLVTGDEHAGGLVGRNKHYAWGNGGQAGSATMSFWDIETSSQQTSACGSGLTTAEMQNASVFLEAGWHLMGETEDGTEDIWWILEGHDYPRLWWERLPGDEIVLVVDDFESYNDIDPPDPASHRIFDVWIDGFGIATNGALLALCQNMPTMKPARCRPQQPVHGGQQSMDFYYDNSGTAHYSEVTRTLTDLRDWTVEDVRVLSLWLNGDPSGVPVPMYVSIANTNGPAATVFHDSLHAALVDTWTEWRINLQEFVDQGVDLTSVDSVSIGLGDKDNPQSGGSGLVFFDNIRLCRQAEPWP